MRQQGHLVITVHGIQTFGKWQNRLASILHRAAPSIHVLNYSYGYFAAFFLLLPPTRWIATRRFRRWILNVVKRRRDVRIDIVAHSFGTYLVAWALRGIPPPKRPRIHTILLASTVLRPNFPWQRLISDGTVTRVINECAWNDWALATFQLIPCFLIRPGGLAGRYGFTGGLSGQLVNRYFLFGHSGYFRLNGKLDDSFMTKRWLPLLITLDPVEIVDERPDSAGLLGGLWISFLNNWHFVNITLFVGFPLAWLLFTRSDAYQVRSIIKDAPASQAVASFSLESLTAWTDALRSAGYLTAAATAANLAAASVPPYRRDYLRDVLVRLQLQVHAGQATSAVALSTDLHEALVGFLETGCVWGSDIAQAQGNPGAAHCRDYVSIANDLPPLARAIASQSLRSDANALVQAAYAAARGSRAGDLRCVALTAFAAAVYENWRPAAAEALAEVRASLPAIPDGARRGIRQVEAMRAFNLLGSLQESLVLADSIEDTERRTAALVELAGAAARLHELDIVGRISNQLMPLLKSIPSSGWRDLLTANYVKALAETSRLREAYAAAREIQLSYYRSEAFGALAVAYAAARDLTRAATSIDLARTAALRLSGMSEQSSALLSLAAAYARLRQRSNAVEAFAAARDAASQMGVLEREGALAAVAIGLARAGYLGEAQRALDFIASEAQRSRAAGAVAQEAARTHQYRRARLIAQQCLAPDKLAVYASILSNYRSRDASRATPTDSRPSRPGHATTATPEAPGGSDR